MVICIDFDGTVVAHEYPQVGRDIGAVPVLKKLIKAGHHLILYTMRSGQYLQDAENWFNENDIPLYAVNVNPTQSSWTQSPKCYANLYIDDSALGTPLSTDGFRTRPIVDWKGVEALLISKKII